MNGVVGFGVFAKKPFQVGEPVVQYCGELIESRAAMNALLSVYSKLPDSGNFIFTFKNSKGKMLWFVHIYIFHIYLNAVT